MTDLSIPCHSAAPADADAASVVVIGGGLAGTEAAWQLAERGLRVALYEMRPRQTTGAHVSDRLAGELVCSNSLGSKLFDRATGLLQTEIRLLGSLLMRIAEQTAVPAGGALAVDREAFAQAVSDAVEHHPNITLHREELKQIPRDVPCIVATGPLTSLDLSADIAVLGGQEHLYFYDALSPIVEADSIDMDVAFTANRYDRGDDEDGDYINCPMDREQYLAFVAAVAAADTIELRDFERDDPNFFEGCVPIEQLARRGERTLAFGPMRPVGITDPHTGRRPYAVVQLRQDNLSGSLYNIVGFQTNMKWDAQKAVLRMIPGLQNARFVRLGQMHRNTFVNSPTLLTATLRFRPLEQAYFAGQISGIEGYTGNIATGIVAAVNLARQMQGEPAWELPVDTMLGALCHYVSHAEPKHFQPMKANFGLLPEHDTTIRDKRLRKVEYARRAMRALHQSVAQLHDPVLDAAVTAFDASFSEIDALSIQSREKELKAQADSQTAIPANG